MPNPNKFLKGFEIHSGMEIADFDLVHIDIGHNTIVRYRQYEYPITLHFKYLESTHPTESRITALIRAVQTYVFGNRTILSGYGNPYSCNFGTIQYLNSNGQDVVLTSLGTGNRV
jgi:hypothetical protein